MISCRTTRIKSAKRHRRSLEHVISLAEANPTVAAVGGFVEEAQSALSFMVLTLYEVDQGAEAAQVVDGRGKGGEGPVKSFGGPD